MAEHGSFHYATAEGNDYTEHERTYNLVMKLIKICTGTALLTMLSLAAYAISEAKVVMTIGLVLAVVSGVIGLSSRNGTAVPLIGSTVVVLLLWAVAG